MCLIRYGQFLATFCAARGQYASAVLRGHSLSETVLVIAATVVGLKCSFHCLIVLFLLFILAYSNSGCKITHFFSTDKKIGKKTS